MLLVELDNYGRNHIAIILNYIAILIIKLNYLLIGKHMEPLNYNRN